MSTKPSIKKTACVALDSRPSVVDSDNKVSESLNRIDRSRLDPARKGEYEAIGGELQTVMARFDHECAQMVQADRASLNQIEIFNDLRKLGFMLLIMAAVVVVFIEWRVALALLIVAIVGTIVVKRILTAQSERFVRYADDLS